MLLYGYHGVVGPEKALSTVINEERYFLLILIIHDVLEACDLIIENISGSSVLTPVSHLTKPSPMHRHLLTNASPVIRIPPTIPI